MDKPDVFMPLYIGDYLAGTARLTTELHGAYLLLIMDYWMNGPLPDDNQALASITKMSPIAWGNARAVLEKYFSIAGGCWMHKRIEKELQTAMDKKADAKRRAEKAAAARWGKNGESAEKPSEKIIEDASSNAKGDARALLEECPSPSPSPSPIQPKGCNNKVKNKKPISAEYVQLAEHFYDSIRTVQPDFRKPDFHKWADHIRLMEKQDQRAMNDIVRVWAWARNDSFWRKNILSPAKLREKFDQLKANMGNPNEPVYSGNVTAKSPVERFVQQHFPADKNNQ